MDKDNSELLLRDICDDSKIFKLNDGCVFPIGRNRETKILDTRCSRVQCKEINSSITLNNLTSYFYNVLSNSI